MKKTAPAPKNSNVPAKPNHPEAQESGENLLSEVQVLLDKVHNSHVPPNLKTELTETLNRLNRAMQHSFYQVEFEQTTRYVEWLLAIPWGERSSDNLDLQKAKEILDKNHFGLDHIKERVLEYLSVLKLQAEHEKTGVVTLSRSPVLCFVGLPGTGKTSLGASIAESLGRNFIRLPMGGLASTLILRGQTRAYPEAEPGSLVKGLARVGTKNPVILLDEIDSIAQGAESDVMGVLLELLDPEQNSAFVDYYVDHPVDLSEVLFVCSANKIGGISSAVMDRLEIIIMPRYSEEDKIQIARDYLFPKELQNVSLDENIVTIADDAWPHIIKPFGYDIDIRALQRTINGILRKVAKKYVEGKISQVTISAATLPEFLPEFV
ncbi:MAG: AAA family ATPase [Candidatus Woykebacteria bacterium]